MKNDINMRKTWKLGYKINNKIVDFFDKLKVASMHTGKLPLILIL
jgi:hypothetical protein